MISINTDYRDYNNNTVTVVALNEIKPNDRVTTMLNKHHQHRVMPLVEFVSENGDLHIMDMESFSKIFTEL